MGRFLAVPNLQIFYISIQKAIREPITAQMGRSSSEFYSNCKTRYAYTVSLVPPRSPQKMAFLYDGQID